MIALKTPRGLPVAVPESLLEDPSPRFDKDHLIDANEYLIENGYVIVSGLFDGAVCDRIRSFWDKEVKPFGGYMYRQATAKAERHAFNANNWIMNPILNLQSVNAQRFPKFRSFAISHVLSSSGLRNVFTTFFGQGPKIVQSMYFEGNSATWEHQDSYYLDSEFVGEMVAAWIALEDISPTAGRFFICPQSHKIRLEEHSLANNIAVNHEGYIESVVAKIREENLPIRAPCLSKGDVLFWNSFTIHGSLDSQDSLYSRSSITCHAIPASRKFLQLQTRVMELPTDNPHGTALFHPKDQKQLLNRLILWLESHFATQFYWIKRKVIVHSIGKKRGTTLAAPK
jgi:phytanoyl-CoA hydroxylase